MYTLRCTGKLLKRLGPVTELAREPPTTLLGDAPRQRRLRSSCSTR
ncbi:hypothetical protein [Anaeromyxobacter dehalogenans]|nr:hypothetical protein [Anaeromyxobacter dehalogenans]